MPNKLTAAELIAANKELAFQNIEKEKRAAELVIANIELDFQNREKEKRAAELIIANKELSYQNREKEKRAAELIIANKELSFQNQEKEKRAAELIIANKELSFQNQEKEKRAAELIIANKELSYQNLEKEKRAAELIIANTELVFQNKEKEKRAAELFTANRELKKAEDSIRKLNEEDIRKLNEVLEQKVIERTEELEAANQELEAFSYSVSHDLRAPLRIVNGYAIILQEEYQKVFDEEGRRLLSIVQDSAKKMGVLIDDLLTFSRLGRNGVFKTNVDMNAVVKNGVDELTALTDHKATITVHELLPVLADYSLISQVWINLLSNAIKYSVYAANPTISISCVQHNAEIIYSITDNGVGFDMQYAHKLFGVFQRLHGTEEFEGTGVGLALVHRIIKKHGGKIWANAEIDKGATFNFSLPQTDIKK
jgi:signal transduction histidine kinase